MQVNEVSIPEETQIYYSKFKHAGSLIFCIVPLSFAGIMLMNISKDPILSAFGIVFFLLIGIGNGYSSYKALRNRRPQITISNRGIQGASSDFYPWKDIVDIKVLSPISLRGSDYVWISLAKGEAKLKLDALSANKFELQQLILIYRRRGDPYKEKI